MSKGSIITIIILLFIITCFTVICAGGFYGFSQVIKNEDTLLCTRQLTTDLEVRITYHKSFEYSYDEFEFNYRNTGWQPQRLSIIDESDYESAYGKKVDRSSNELCSLLRLEESKNILVIAGRLYSFDGGRTLQNIADLELGSSVKNEINEIRSQANINNDLNDRSLGPLHIDEYGKLTYTIHYRDFEKLPNKVTIELKYNNSWYVSDSF